MGTTQRTKPNGFLALPGGPEIRQQHRRRSQRRIWGQELAPSRPQTHGGYGRNTTGGWLADDPRVVPPRPGACGVVVLGLVYRSANKNIPAAPGHDRAGIWTIAREKVFAFNSLRGGCKP